MEFQLHRQVQTLAEKVEMDSLIQFQELQLVTRLVAAAV
jgi:hypothetical protein